MNVIQIIKAARIWQASQIAAILARAQRIYMRKPTKRLEQICAACQEQLDWFAFLNY